MKKVQGVGVNDLKGRWHCCSRTADTSLKKYQARVYNLWQGMFQRCYSKVSYLNSPTYLGVQVCERWRVFSNFVRDIKFLPNYQMWLLHPKERVSLNKEYWVPTKIYSPFTCGFCSIEDNSRESINRNKDKIYDPNLIQSRNRKSAQTRAKKVKATNIKNPSDIRVYNSAIEAEKDGFRHQEIGQCCKGRHKSHKGYRWEYI